MTRSRCAQTPWTLAPADAGDGRRARARTTGLSLIDRAHPRRSRGMRHAEAVERFLAPTSTRDWRDPDADSRDAEAADAVAEAVRAGEHIVVFGDFDLDGISAAAVAARGLRAMGARRRRDRAAPVPRGLRSVGGGDRAAHRAASPTSSSPSTAGSRRPRRSRCSPSAGVDVVVTDHHEPGDRRARRRARGDPKLDPAVPVPATWPAPASRSSSCRRSARGSACPTCGAS